MCSSDLIYATACLAGALAYWLIAFFGGSPMVQQLSCAAVVIMLRVLALRYSLQLPVLHKIEPNITDDKPQP